MITTKNLPPIQYKLVHYRPRSAWEKGVRLYALELVDNVDIDINDFISWDGLKRKMLNGATSWHEYSWGGSALCYDQQIAQRLCTASELKRCHNGLKPPNKRENWLDTQARALYQAELLIKKFFMEVL